MREETQIKPPGEAQTQTSRTHRQKKKHTHTRKQDITLLTDTVPGVYCIPGSRVKESAVEKGEKIKVIKHATCQSSEKKVGKSSTAIYKSTIFKFLLFCYLIVFLYN